jgi:hypothetical protein
MKEVLDSFGGVSVRKSLYEARQELDKLSDLWRDNALLINMAIQSMHTEQVLDVVGMYLDLEMTSAELTTTLLTFESST